MHVGSDASTKPATDNYSAQPILSLLPDKQNGTITIVADTPIPQDSNVERTVRRCHTISNQGKTPYNFMTQFSDAMMLSKGSKSAWKLRGEFDKASQNALLRKGFYQVLGPEPNSKICLSREEADQELATRLATVTPASSASQTSAQVPSRKQPQCGRAGTTTVSKDPSGGGSKKAGRRGRPGTRR
jgi:hypothetical protein